MKLTVNKVKEGTLEEFADRYGFEMVVKERANPSDPNMKFYAKFPRCEILERSLLIGKCGNGETVEDAIRDYASQISGELLVKNAHTKERQEIRVWRLTCE